VVDRRRWRALLAAGLLLFSLFSPISGALATTATGRDVGSAVAVAALDAGVVDVTTQLGYSGASSAGTGIVVDPQGEVLTNNHVIRDGTDIRVTVPSGGEYPARVLLTDPDEDIALLQVLGAPALTPATLGDSSTAAVGDAVTAVGNAGGVGGPPTVASGKITGLDRSITVTDDHGNNPEHLHGLIETDARVVPGDSGGPLLNAAGGVIGMDTAAADAGDQQAPPDGFAIPINHALDVVHGMQAGPPA
jgi:S1-C subfamily serine protease